MQEKFPMTVAGEASLQEALHKLKTVDRPQVTSDIATAREHGDLKENAEYHAAREEQGLIEAQIKDLEYKLSLSQVVDIHKLKQDGRVVFGVTVVLEDIDTEEEVTYKIVGQDESDIKLGLLAYNSPIAKALIGNEEGDAVEIETPGGNKNYEILDVLYK